MCRLPRSLLLLASVLCLATYHEVTPAAISGGWGPTEKLQNLADIGKWMSGSATLAGVITNTAPALSATVNAEAATVSTDKPDYAPGETAIISGTGWQSGETVRLQVVHLNGGGDDGEGHDPWNVTADASGNISSYWYVNPDDSAFATFLLTADGLSSGFHAEATFTDLAIGTYDQCSNDDGDGYDSGDVGCRWINGNLQANNSTYAEGDATVQRVWLTDFAAGTHTITLQYGTTKQGTHAYDYLTRWDWSENWITIADRCQDITGCAAASENALGIPNDPNVDDSIELAGPGSREFVMRGGTLVSATTPAIVSGDYTGDSETAITISFTVPSAGPMCETKQGTTTCAVALWFGAHIARTDQWTDFNGTTGAGDIEGSPYHVQLAEVDDASVGQRDNQMQANTIVVDPCQGVTCNDTVCADLECNPSNGLCEVVDYLAGTVCRPGSGDVCDPPEVCVEGNTECPVDIVAPATTVCNPGSGDICDPAESCTGVPGAACPVDTIAPATTICNAGSGDICDPAESCTGIADQACPADVIAPATTICNAGSGDICDPAESCTGIADQACPADTIAPATTQCRAGSGDICDPAESCTGIADQACPADVIAPATTVCREGSGDVCDPDESCTGVALATCPADEIAPATTICRPDSGICDVEESCPGDGGACPADLKEECGVVTDSSLCAFDFGPGDTCETDDAQFKLLFTPDAQSWPAYKLNASNPGQFYYNAIVSETAGSTVPVTFTIPWPFVTHGARPVHVYDGTTVETNGCFVPTEEALASFPATFGLANYAAGTGHSGSGYSVTCDLVAPNTLPNNTGLTCTVVVNVVIPASGVAYVNMHLDYGLKGKDADGNPIDGSPDRYDASATESPIAPGTRDALVNTATGTGAVAIETCTPYTFAHSNGGSFSDTVQNLNFFKRISGAFGLLKESINDTGLVGVSVELLNKTGQVVARGTTDQDGYYLLAYKHKGKSAPYTVVINGSLTKQVELKANGWAEVSYDVTTNTWTVSVSGK